VVVQVAAFAAMLIAMASLTIDVGAMYNAKADLQRTADAAALAAASRLADYGDDTNPLDLARATATELAQHNDVLGQSVTIDVDTDITFGRATFNSASQQYDFIPDNVIPDAVQVRVRKTEDSPNGSLTLFFARIFGMNTANLSAEAVAVMVPRDIAIVADLSGSHNDDSEFRHYRMTEINLFDVWDNLPGGANELGSVWDEESLPDEWFDPDGSASQAAGPAWGYMKELGFGVETISTNYDPVADGGLVELPFSQNWSDAQLESHLVDQGYIASEVAAILSNEFDGQGAYAYRVAVALGLAFWNSGQPGGLWEQRGVDPSATGNANNWIGGSELSWTEGILSRSAAASSGIWLDYINNYMSATSSTMYNANHDFRYRYGIKTFLNYLMENRTTHNQTPEFANAPTQPMQAVKDALTYMVDLIDDLDSDDQLSLEVYGTTGRHEVDLTHNHQEISQRFVEMQSGHYDSWTNMGGGIQRAIEELTSSRARERSRKVIILLTDGNANVSASGQVADYSGGAAYSVAQAEEAAALGIRIFAVSVGTDSNQSLMAQVADIANGEHFHAEGSIAEYSQQLASIFHLLGSKRPVELIR
jgi:hypothetical protein